MFDDLSPEDRFKRHLCRLLCEEELVHGESVDFAIEHDQHGIKLTTVRYLMPADAPKLARVFEKLAATVLAERAEGK